MAIMECAKRGWLTEDHNVAEACLIFPVFRERKGVRARSGT